MSSSNNNNNSIIPPDGHGHGHGFGLRLGRRPGKGAVDKSNFTQTCHLLSQFLKDKRTSNSSSSSPPTAAPHVTLPITSSPKTDTTTTPPTPPAATMNLLTNLQDSDDASRLINASAMDLLPQFMENPSIKHSNNLRSESVKGGQPQLSIFYAGKVLVFDGFPPEKATEVMELATKLGSSDSSAAPSKLPHPHPSPSPSQSNTTAHQHAPDMRYPRRASLVKFLEKRKERVIAKGPYHINNPKQDGASSGSDPEQHNQSSEHFDLNS